MASSTTYLIMLAAILAEVVATTALARSDNFTRVVPTVITVFGYGIAFYLLSFPLRVIPTGIVYAVWSGMGIVLIALIGWIGFGQKLDTPAILGLGLIVVGVIILNVFSKSVLH